MPRRPDSAPLGPGNPDFFGDYEDTWPPSDGELSEAAQAAASVRFQPREAQDPQAVENAVEEYRGRHRREVPKSSKLARLRKAWRRR